MTQNAKKLTAYALRAFVVIVTLIALLAVWEAICLEDVMIKIIKSMFILFGASVLSLFIYNVVLKADK